MTSCIWNPVRVTDLGTVYRCERCSKELPPLRASKPPIMECLGSKQVRVPTGPSTTARLTHYARALLRWQQAGRPVRSDSEITGIFNQYCGTCDWYKDGLCRHESCGCNVRPVESHHPLALAAKLIGASHPVDVMTNKLAWKTESCPIGKWPVQEKKQLRWVTLADRAAATKKLATILPSSITAVAGVSRSGLSSAMQIAEMLHLHPFSVSIDSKLTPLSCGWRFRGSQPDDGDLLIVDDTVASGTSIRQIKSSISRLGRKNVWFGVTYASSEASHLVDFYAERLEIPHLLEWNFFNSVYSPETALDFDGVLCRDCRPEEVYDVPAYENFLATAEPVYLPRRCAVPLIVTARLEKYRKPTEDWLNRWGIRWHKLVMGHWPTIEDRNREYKASEFKGLEFAKSQCKWFVESCPIQAREISKVSLGKVVICSTTGEVFQ